MIKTSLSSYKLIILVLFLVLFLSSLYMLMQQSSSTKNQQQQELDHSSTIRDVKSSTSTISTHSSSHLASLCSKKIIFLGDSNTPGLTYMLTNPPNNKTSKSLFSSFYGRRFLNSTSSSNFSSSSSPKYSWVPRGGYPKFVMTKLKTICSRQFPSPPNSPSTKTFSSYDSVVFAEGNTGISGYGSTKSVLKKNRKNSSTSTPSQQLVNVTLGTVSFKETLAFKRLKRSYSSPSSSVDIAFILFGTNEVIRSNNNESMTEEHIYESYRTFILNELFEKMKIKHVILITPPYIMKTCMPWAPYCLTMNSELLKTRVVPTLRRVVQSFNETEFGENKVDLIDFFQIQQNEIEVGKQNILKKNNKKNKKNNFVVVDPEETLRNYYQADGVHLSPKGHVKLGQVVWRWMMNRNTI